MLLPDDCGPAPDWPLSFDRRIADWLAAGRFLRTVQEHLQTRAPELVRPEQLGAGQ